MKKILSFILLLFWGCSLSPDPNLPEVDRELIIYYDYNDLSKEIIYNRTISWIADSYKSPKSVIEFNDKDIGKIVIRGETDFKWQSFVGSALPHICRYKFIIDIKDNKIRLTFTDFTGTMPDNMGGVRWEPMKRKTHIDSVKNQFVLYGIQLDKYIKYFNNQNW